MFTSEQIREVKQKVDIVDFMEEYVQLNRSGSNYQGACPLHNGTNKNFSVSRKYGGIWHCFSKCENGKGDIFSFYQRFHKVSFNEAVIDIARKYNIPLELSEEIKDSYERKKLLYTINEDAANFYKKALRFNNRVKSYLRVRKIDPVFIEKFDLGADSYTNNELTTSLLKKYKQDDLVASGILSRSTSGSIYETFQNRLIIPIRNENSRVVGFTARTLDEKIKPKYRNTSDTEVFEKRNILYGLNYAKESIRNYNSVIITEGQFDVIRSFSVGIENVVAVSGSSLTKEQAVKLSKITNNFTLAFDNDEAGKKAIESSYDIIKSNTKNSNIKVLKWV